jgi:hypothetical protein
MYRTYESSGDPQLLFAKASAWLLNIKGYEIDSEKEEVVFRELRENMCQAVFGSNFIERVGLGLDVTTNLCQQIFNGEHIDDCIGEKSKEYQNLLHDFVLKNPSKDPGQHVLRSRREVTQHAKAFQYIIDAMVVESEPLTGHLIKRVHKILCRDISITHNDGSETPANEYAGVYRVIPVHAGNTMFMNPQHIGSKMRDMIITAF